MHAHDSADDFEDKVQLLKGKQDKYSKLKSLVKIAEGQYFGDEEGFEIKKKQYFVKVTALDTVLFSINKSKI